MAFTAPTGYYDNFNPLKDYTKLLFLAGGVLQSNEMNVMQDIIQKKITGVADTIMNNGDIIEGLQMVFNEQDATRATIRPGKIYLDGLIREKTTASEFTNLPTSGTYYIVAYVDQTAVTHATDSTILDPSVTTGNAGMPGAPRLKETLMFRAVQEGQLLASDHILYRVQGGELVNNPRGNSETEMLSKINDILAQRTYETEGNYKVNGLELSVPYPVNYVTQNGIRCFPVNVSAGNAYVRGYRVSLPTATTAYIQCPQLTSSMTSAYAQVTDESFLLDDELMKIYYVTKKPVCSTEGNTGTMWDNADTQASNKLYVTAPVMTSDTFSTTGNASYTLNHSLDASAPGSVTVKVGNVTQSSSDYTISSRTLTFTSNIPSSGNTLTVEYAYRRRLAYNTEWILGNGTNPFFAIFMDGGRGGSQIYEGGVCYVSYCYALCRKDAIVITDQGEIVVTQGRSGERDVVEPPTTGNDNSLTLGTVLYDPSAETNNAMITLVNNQTQALSMLSMYKMLRRISELEYCFAASELDNDAAASESVSELVGIFTDNFTSLRKMDTMLLDPDNPVSVDGNVVNGVAIDPDTNEMTVQSDEEVFNYRFNDPNASAKRFSHDATKITTGTDGYYNQIHWAGSLTDTESTGHGRYLLMGGCSGILVALQPHATGTMRINSYSAFPTAPTVTLTPSSDQWTENVMLDTITGGSSITTQSLRRWWYHGGEAWVENERALWEAAGFEDGGSSLGWGSGNVTFRHSVTETVSDDAAQFMRVRDIAIEIRGLTPNANRILITFNGILINDAAAYSNQWLTPGVDRYDFARLVLNSDPEAQMWTNWYGTGTQLGNESGKHYYSLIADENGVARGCFAIPDGTPCGTVEVAAFEMSTPEYKGRANYTSEGRIVTQRTRVWEERVVVNPVDPLAQSFILNEDRIIYRLNLYFSSVSPLPHDITVQIRNLENGYPGNIVYGEATRHIANSTDATNLICSFSNTKVGNTYYSNPTMFAFMTPVFCHKDTPYCFTVMTNNGVARGTIISDNNNNIDAVLIAKTGDALKDIPSSYGTQTPIVAKNPYLEGMLFSSSNAITWSAHQDMDMMFELFAYQFVQGVTSCEFTSIGKTNSDSTLSNSNYDRFTVNAVQSLPAGTSAQWSYRLDNEAEWKPMEVYSDKALRSYYGTFNELHIKVELTPSSDGTVSPVIDLPSISVACFKQKTEGTYLTKTIGVPDGYNTVKIVLDALTVLDQTSAVAPSMTVQYSTETNPNLATSADWKTIPNTVVSPSGTTAGYYTRSKSDGYTEYTFRQKPGGTYSSFKLRLKLNTPTQRGRLTVKNLRVILKDV